MRLAWDMPITWDDLSPRQQRVIRGLARGLSNQEIADDLGMSLPAVRNTLADLYPLLYLSNRVQVLLWVMAHDDVAAEILATV